MSISNQVLLTVPKTASTLAEVKPGDNHVYLGKATSGAEIDKLVADFKKKVAIFHDTAETSTTFIFKDLIRQNDQTFNLKYQLSRLRLFVKKSFVELSSNPESIYLAQVLIACISSFALIVITNLVRERVLKLPVGKMTPAFSAVIVTAATIYIVCIPPILHRLVIAWNRHQDYLRWHRIDHQNIPKPKDVFLVLERKETLQDRKTAELSNRVNNVSKCLIDPIDGTIIQDHDLNSPRVLVLGKNAVHIRSLMKCLLDQESRTVSVAKAVPDLAVSEADGKEALRDLSAFFCMQNEDFYQLLWLFDSEEKRRKLKVRLDPVFHKYIEDL